MFRPLRFDPKDPQDINTFTCDFDEDLDDEQGETILTADVGCYTDAAGTMVYMGLARSSPLIGGTKVSVNLTGGIAGQPAYVQFMITTSLNHTICRRVLLPIENR
jgi:hypothetical protein